MLLVDALRIAPGDVVAFTGGGGKTTAMFRLATEIVQQGGYAITTTTTRIFAAQTKQAPCAMALSEPPSEKTDFLSQLKEHGHVLVTGEVDDSLGKAFGVTRGVFDWLRSIETDPRPVILIEADGSRMRAFKAPAEHEPVIPESATVVVPVVGVDVIGKKLNLDNVHRAELTAKLADVSIGDEITPDIVARVVSHPSGGRKGLPAAARWIPLINKVESELERESAREIAEQLLAGGARVVVIGSVRSDDPIRTRFVSVTAIVLAAGGSTRMAGAGQIKQLLEWQGQPLVVHVTQVALESECQDAVVVVGNKAKKVLATLGHSSVIRAVNSEWQSGQSSSVRAGLLSLPSGTQAALFLLVDQPGINVDVINAVLERYRSTGAPIVAPRVDGRIANPVLFDRTVWPELRELRGDEGGRQLFKKYEGKIELVDWGDEILVEINTPEDYARIVQT